MKTATCGYICYGEENAESVSQVIMALCALGIDPEEDPRFDSGGMDPMSELARFRQSDGTYGHTLEDEKGDSMATVQALEALLSVQGLRNGNGYIFLNRHFPALQQKKDVGAAWVILPAAIIAVTAFAVTARKRRNNGTAD